MSAGRCIALVCVAALGSACGDEIVGSFGGGTTHATTTTGASNTGVATMSGTTGDATTDTTATGGSSGVPDDSGFMAPGCFGDDFEDGVIDPLWNTWAEEDSSLEEIGGTLSMTPPSFGIWDTGVVGAYNYVFPFVEGYARVRVPSPPDPARPVLLFLTVSEQDGAALSIQLTGGKVITSVSVGLESQFHQEFPMAYPAWIGLRAEGTQVHFEISDDGTTFTELAVSEKVTGFAIADALLMAQTAGTDTDRSPIVVDDFEVCAQ